jgi:hypothetical protein
MNKARMIKCGFKGKGNGIIQKADGKKYLRLNYTDGRTNLESVVYHTDVNPNQCLVYVNGKKE